MKAEKRFAYQQIESDRDGGTEEERRVEISFWELFDFGCETMRVHCNAVIVVARCMLDSLRVLFF